MFDSSSKSDMAMNPCNYWTTTDIKLLASGIWTNWVVEETGRDRSISRGSKWCAVNSTIQRHIHTQKGKTGQPALPIQSFI